MSWKYCLEADPNHWMIDFVLTEIKSKSRIDFKEFLPEPIPHINVFKAFKYRAYWELYFTLSAEDELNKFNEDHEITSPEVEVVKNFDFPHRRVTRIYFDDNRSALYCLPRAK